MSWEVRKYIEEAPQKNQNLFNENVLSFPKEKKISATQNFEVNTLETWKLYDKSSIKEDGDQLKAVIGICFMFVSLILIGLYANFL